MVFCDVVPSVHQIVGHDIEEIQRQADRGHLCLGEGQHISRQSWYSSRNDLFRTKSGTNLREQQWIGFDLPGFLRIRNLLVILAVSTLLVLAMHEPPTVKTV